MLQNGKGCRDKSGLGEKKVPRKKATEKAQRWGGKGESQGGGN